ncbi:MAG TPA: type II toxin-antitoxin system RelE/ParE family toxin [Lentisphaeria bacterium]|nr:MAG: plasmid stabilization protein [Lentisphaerae bacterium GWF2_49_21]HBC86406.1 type II toxin-antitoxin system RelE/ParE family toxin [Lentisphaeria bacterium]
MAEIRWTLQALDDVEAIAKYISRDSTHYAQLFTIKVFDAVRQIEIFPESGRIVPEIKQKYIREIILGNYRIIYRQKNDCAEILTVYHSSRLLDNESITNRST